MPAHGLDYEPAFLDSLPTVPSCDPTSPPIPVLSTDELAELHLRHIISHAPDHVVFPFLHGVEGTNAAQNLFFSSADTVPRYRGLMYVVCEDELDDDTDDDSDDLDSSSDMEVDTDIDVDAREMRDDGVAVHVGDEVMEIGGIGATEGGETGKERKEAHMHPVAMRPPPPLLTPEYPPHSSRRLKSRSPPVLTSTFKPSELIHECAANDWAFVPLRVPDGISLRNFGIQVPILVTLSDIVIYSPTSTGAKASQNARKLAERFRMAISKKKQERLDKLRAQKAASTTHDDNLDDSHLTDYTVFLLDATEADLLAPDSKLRHLVRRYAQPSDSTESCLSDESAVKCNTINFATREKDEMRDLTAASELLRIERAPQTPPTIPENPDRPPPVASQFGQIFLGNSNDVPVPGRGDGKDFDYDYGSVGYHSRRPTNPAGYDICIECHDLAPFPSPAHMKAAEDQLTSLETRWRERVAEETGSAGGDIPPRPPVHANSVIHLPFPSSPTGTAPMKNLVRFLERWLTPSPAVSQDKDTAVSTTSPKRKDSEGRRWSLLSSAPSFPLFNMSSSAPSPSSSSRIRSFTSPSPSHPVDPPHTHAPSRPIKVLIYSSDGYTESSVLALCLLISLKRVSLPEAYLELQVAKERSFFVYTSDLGILRRWEAEERGGSGGRPVRGSKYFGHHREGRSMEIGAGVNPYVAGWGPTTEDVPGIPMSSSVPNVKGVTDRTGRPRASTLPASSVFGWDHQTWFDDPRFDGSFPSRVLPFLYLGNLNHASNVFMLHALGITHVVSVGECALVPPPNATCHDNPSNPNAGLTTHYISSPTNVKRGSLWIEERAGRIKVLDIQGVCDDGIDTLEPQLAPISQWIDEARREGGKVLVHCRVGVSRSATVVIAYVMQHLRISLVEAYLIVRSRRLSVLIQPNMRLLYNLCGWEVRLARERVGEGEGGEEERLREELAGAVTWPFLAKEVHKLNEKYLR